MLLFVWVSASPLQLWQAGTIFFQQVSLLVVLTKNGPLTYKMVVLWKDVALLILIPWRPQASG